MGCAIGRIYFTPRDRIDACMRLQKGLGLNIDEKRRSAYLPRAVSSVPQEIRGEIDKKYSKLVGIVKTADLTANLPCKLSDRVREEEINPTNHRALIESKFVIPFMYSVSDGRGWEMGFAYGWKLLIPILLKGQRVNVPTTKLPFQIPLFIDFDNRADRRNLKKLLKEFMIYDIGTGKCKEHGVVLLGFENGNPYCLKGIAEEFDLTLVKV